MLLDNLFEFLGTSGTSWIMLGILGFVGLAPARQLLAPSCPVLAAIRSTRRI